MSFKDVASAEVFSAFLNPLEFASEVEIDGKLVLAVIDDGSQSFATGAADNLRDTAGLGLLEHGRTLYVADCDFEARPVPEQEMEINGKRWIVLDCEVQQGLLVVKLTRVFA